MAIDVKQDVEGLSVPEKLIRDLCYNSTHACILGMRETGKTTIGMAILDWCRELKTKECVVYKHPKPQLLPKWIKNITDIRELTCNQVVLIDEGSSDFDQFSYAKQSNRYLAQELKKARHKNISFVFIDHSSDFLNKNMLRLIDIWLLKRNTDFNIEDERRYIKHLYNGMQKMPEINQVWVHTDRYEGIVEVDMPGWFTDRLSKAYDNDNNDVVKVDDVIKRITGGGKRK